MKKIVKALSELQTQKGNRKKTLQTHKLNKRCER